MKKRFFQDHEEVVQALRGIGLNMSEYGEGRFKGRRVRVNNRLEVQIGDDRFDRWANSVAASFQPIRGRIERQFLKATKEAGVL